MPYLLGIKPEVEPHQEMTGLDSEHHSRILIESAHSPPSRGGLVACGEQLFVDLPRERLDHLPSLPDASVKEASILRVPLLVQACEWCIDLMRW